MAEYDAAAEITEHIRDLYRHYGDRPGFDAHLDADLTIWESDVDRLLTGLPALDALRDGKQPTPDAPELLSLAPEGILAQAWGDTGVVRYLLRARYVAPGPDDDRFRVTDVLRRTGDGWLIVHHHAEATGFDA